ncbi:hypothetical protein G6O69_38850 [Pseudenhygromyxa sp. WMMC2535]|uniref:hypothetical protein n=1 Tax=Pseudenhygromyxa sp. WMMC2535 TaxID=2712867 RepID=UPI0015959A2C|nr:hypothetical protein [Pseudenhygromyxa sp. WMMC2535]NVB43818.1 hypothetical protein [Pseudenhygromyxa sp. WMMC2535]
MSRDRALLVIAILGLRCGLALEAHDRVRRPAAVTAETLRVLAIREPSRDFDETLTVDLDRALLVFVVSSIPLSMAANLRFALLTMAVVANRTLDLRFAEMIEFVRVSDVSDTLIG